MSQNQSDILHTPRHNVYLKRSAKLNMLLSLMVVLTLSTICVAEIGPQYTNDVTAMGRPTEVASVDVIILEDERFNVAKNLPNVDTPKVATGNAGFVDAFTSSLTVILLTELGDKTFFIAAIMAMGNSRIIVFSGAILALILMTVVSVVFGMAATIIPKVYTYYISSALFVVFGLKMIYEGYMMKPTDAKEELEEVQSDVNKRVNVLEREVTAINVTDPESGTVHKNTRKRTIYLNMRVLMQSFTMTFLAEWGDRSQLTTIILAASKDAFGICVGGILGHIICTGLAVIGGRMVAAKISVRTVTIIGGIVFLAFAAYAFIVPPDDI